MSSLGSGFIFCFREWKGEGGGREKHQSAVSHVHPDRRSSPPPGRVLDQESHQWPFSVRVDTQPTEPHGHGWFFKIGMHQFFNFRKKKNL